MFDAQEHEVRARERRRQEAEKERETRTRAMGKAHDWTADAAMRFGITSREMLDAVRRGWTPEMINELPAAEVDNLFEKPSSDPETAKLIRNIRTAPILPVPYKSWH